MQISLGNTTLVLPGECSSYLLINLKFQYMQILLHEGTIAGPRGTSPGKRSVLSRRQGRPMGTSSLPGETPSCDRELVIPSCSSLVYLFCQYTYFVDIQPFTLCKNLQKPCAGHLSICKGLHPWRGVCLRNLHDPCWAETSIYMYIDVFGKLEKGPKPNAGPFLTCKGLTREFLLFYITVQNQTRGTFSSFIRSRRRRGRRGTHCKRPRRRVPRTSRGRRFPRPAGRPPGRRRRRTRSGTCGTPRRRWTSRCQ